MTRQPSHQRSSPRLLHSQESLPPRFIWIGNPHPTPVCQESTIGTNGGGRAQQLPLGMAQEAVRDRKFQGWSLLRTLQTGQSLKSRMSPFLTGVQLLMMERREDRAGFSLLHSPQDPNF